MIWRREQVYVRDFTVQFNFSVQGFVLVAGYWLPADGFCLVIQAARLSAGSVGGGLGYEGVRSR